MKKGKFKLNKNNEIKKKKKGFTLVELLAVISILAVILVVTVPTVITNMNKAKEKAFNTSVSALQKYIDKQVENCKMSSNDMGIFDYNSDIFIDGTCVIDNDKIDNIVNLTGYNNKLVNVFIEKNIVYYAEGKEEFDELIFEREYIASPDLSTGLIPVYYNGDNWIVADINSNWYDYENQMWANGISVTSSSRNNYVNADGSYNARKEVNMDDVLAMFVWIPRYSYTIGCTSSSSCLGYKIDGASDLDIKNPGAIDIKFVSIKVKKEPEYAPTYTYSTTDTEDQRIEKKEASANWYTHPAFTFGDKELSGIWVGKFETSVNNESDCYKKIDYFTNLNMVAASNKDYCVSTKDDVTPRILPNVLTLTYQNAYNQFETARKFTSPTNEYNLTGNAHMMKNSEWGAVAYLSQSKYGKYGKLSYSGSYYREIFTNNSSYFYTGRSCDRSGCSGSKSTYGNYTYDDYAIDSSNVKGSKTNDKGTGASTTGTIYGIYDMNGGTYERVMAWFKDDSEEFGSTLGSNGSYFNNSGFTAGPERKYYDLYEYSQINSKPIETIGHATSETYGWYQDQTNDYSSYDKWIVRGASANTITYPDRTKVGIFAFMSDGTDGNANNSVGFRVTLTNS